MGRAVFQRFCRATYESTACSHLGGANGLFLRDKLNMDF
jgi:hypothetical protein